MLYKRDPDGIQGAEIVAITDFKDKQVLEIGCGDGYLTWAYAPQAARVTAIDPSAEDIEVAVKTTPRNLADKVEFIVSDIRNFALGSRKSLFDIALFTWSF